MAESIETRHRILQQAEQHFRLYGYNKTTVADIAKSCDMSSANVYRYFATKGAIVEGMAEIWLKEMEGYAEEIAQRQQPAKERFAAFVIEMHHRTIERYLEENKVHDLCRMAIDEHFDVVEKHLGRMAEILEDIFRDGCESGEFFIDDVAVTSRVVRTSLAKFHHPYLVAQAQQEQQRTGRTELAGLANVKEVVAFFLEYLGRVPVEQR